MAHVEINNQFRCATYFTVDYSCVSHSSDHPLGSFILC